MMRPAISTWWRAYGVSPTKAPLCGLYGTQVSMVPTMRTSAAASAQSTAASSFRGPVVLQPSKNRCTPCVLNRCQRFA